MGSSPVLNSQLSGKQRSVYDYSSLCVWPCEELCTKSQWIQGNDPYLSTASALTSVHGSDTVPYNFISPEAYGGVWQ